MAITNGYATRAQAKERLDIDGTTFDELIDRLITTASRAIDRLCGRRFYSTSGTRYETAEHEGLVILTDDLLSVTTLRTDNDADDVYETLWTPDDYRLEPVNASFEGKPYTSIRLKHAGAEAFPISVRNGVEIVGSWGHNATDAYPADVNEACLMIQARLFERRHVPLGIVGMPEAGVALWVKNQDPDVLMLLEPYTRWALGAA